jgi:uncharacterized membrane protein YedE/YeeE
VQLIESLGPALLGGALLGTGAALALLFHGRVVGISGLFAGLLLPGYDARATRLLFLVGLVVGALLATPLAPAAPVAEQGPNWWLVIASGVLVGYGAKLGNGCTSGHGICGVSRGSPRSWLATLTFMATGIFTVAVIRALGASQ